MDQNDPKLVKFIQDQLLEKPFLCPDDIEDLNTEVRSKDNYNPYAMQCNAIDKKFHAFTKRKIFPEP